MENGKHTNEIVNGMNRKNGSCERKLQPKAFHAKNMALKQTGFPYTVQKTLNTFTLAIEAFSF